ncbi:hypothetical protein ACFX2I_037328 [Malus domestica]
MAVIESGNGDIRVVRDGEGTCLVMVATLQRGTASPFHVEAYILVVLRSVQLAILLLGVKARNNLKESVDA